jgi:hypothetical protein
MLKARIAILGGLLVALALPPLVAKDARGGRGTSHTPSEFQKAIDDTSNCYKICEATLHHCIEKGGKHVVPEHLNLLVDCTDICQTDIGFMARRSDFYPETCRICADICQKCAESCDRLTPEDPFMRDCAEACRKCAWSCRMIATETRGS